MRLVEVGTSRAFVCSFEGTEQPPTVKIGTCGLHFDDVRMLRDNFSAADIFGVLLIRLFARLLFSVRPRPTARHREGGGSRAA